MDLQERINRALTVAADYGQVDGDHHKAWVIDQMVRELTGDDYHAWVGQVMVGQDGPDTYPWDKGTPP